MFMKGIIWCNSRKLHLWSKKFFTVLCSSPGLYFQPVAEHWVSKGNGYKSVVHNLPAPKSGWMAWNWFMGDPHAHLPTQGKHVRGQYVVVIQHVVLNPCTLIYVASLRTVQNMKYSVQLKLPPNEIIYLILPHEN